MTAATTAVVYHLCEERFLETRMMPADAIRARAMFPQGWDPKDDKDFDLAALVEVPRGYGQIPAAEFAFHCTNHIDNFWQENSCATEVNHRLPQGSARRSTSVGDVVVIRGMALLCASSGWVLIGPVHMWTLTERLMASQGKRPLEIVRTNTTNPDNDTTAA